MMENELAQTAESPARGIAALPCAQAADYCHQGVGDFLGPGTREPTRGLFAQQLGQVTPV
jgi:hypothetical protein